MKNKTLNSFYFWVINIINEIIYHSSALIYWSFVPSSFSATSLSERFTVSFNIMFKKNLQAFNVDLSLDFIISLILSKYSVVTFKIFYCTVSPFTISYYRYSFYYSRFVIFMYWRLLSLRTFLVLLSFFLKRGNP